MNGSPHELEQRYARLLRLHLEAGDEQTLNQAYEFGREALEAGAGILDMGLMAWRAMETVRDRDPALARSAEDHLLECLSPFEMSYRGAREANQSLRQIEEAREEHLRRISRELHDQAGQLLASVHLALEEFRSELTPAGAGRLDHAVDLLHQVEDQLRRLSYELRPMLLDDLGLGPALRFLGEGVERRSGIAVVVEDSGCGRGSPRIETAVYRAVQEGLSNVVRHSRATRAVVRLSTSDRELVCELGDDGCGFDCTRRRTPGTPGGIGLESIRERVTPLGGEVEVASRPGAGTTLTIRVPWEVSHAAAPADC